MFNGIVRVVSVLFVGVLGCNNGQRNEKSFVYLLETRRKSNGTEL